MAVPALMLDLETPVEERLARVEVSVEHIQADVSDIKVDIRRLNDKIDGVDRKLSAEIGDVNQKLSAKIDGVDQKLSAKNDSLKDAIANLTLSMEKSFAELKMSRVMDRIGWLVITGGVLGVLARALHWI